MKKIICVFSGGLDSTVLLYKLVNEGYDVTAVSFNYGQRHTKELEYAAKTCGNLNVKHKLIDISSIVDIFAGSALTDAVDVPAGHYEEESMKVTVVPNRNSIFLNLAMAYGIGKRIYNLSYGAHAGDHEIYPDTRPAFVEAFNKLAKTVDYEPIDVITPFLNIRKEDIVKEGARLGVPFNNTWSCYSGGKIHCGVCGTCTERKEAFQLAGIEDPTEYEE